MTGKRLRLARLMMAMGVPDLWSHGTEGTLLVLNYHRVRARDQTSSDFDDGVFDVDVDTFRRQMQWLRSATEVLDEAALLELGSGARLPRRGLLSPVTFDDGYADCFTLVKPVLDELDIRGLFFIPVELLTSRRLGWWDIAAYLLKHSSRAEIAVRGEVYRLGAGLSQSLRRILNVFKLEPSERTCGLLEEICDACDVALPTEARQSAELMSWDQVRQLRDEGHSIGSHAWSHRPLATLSPEVQSREIRDSRRELEGILGAPVLSFAYPVGGTQHFNDTSVRLVREAGYLQAFSFNTGIAGLPIADRYRIARESAKSFDLLKAKALLPGFMGLRSKSAA